MAKQRQPEEWKILSDSELAARAQRLTVMGLLILVVVVGGLSYLLASAPVAEPGGPSRPVRLHTTADKAPAAPATPATETAAARPVELPPNPWMRKPPAGSKPAPPTRPAQGGGRYDL